jgi:hypothetical protein
MPSYISAHNTALHRSKRWPLGSVRGSGRIDYRHGGRDAVEGGLSSRRKAILEFIRTLLVLMGISVGVLTLCFAFVLMHQVMH